MSLREIGELTEENTSQTIQALGTTVHFHDVGEGDPIVFLHSWGPGCTAWLTWHKVLPTMAKHYRCILMDLPNYAKTGPILYEANGSVHTFQAEMAIALMDALGIERAHVVGNSQGGQTAMEFAYLYPARINKLVWGDGHLNSGPGSYLMSNQPEEGILAGIEYSKAPSRENMRRFLALNIYDQSLITDELITYLYEMDTGRADLVKVRSQIKPSGEPSPDNVKNCMKIQAPTLIIWGRNDRTCTFELGIQALNVIPDSRLVVLKDTAHWPPFEKPAEYATHVLSFLGDYEMLLPD